MLKSCSFYERKSGQKLTAYARNDVILSAGAIATPQLLMLSGIGDDVLLNEIGIPVRKTLRQVGKNLQSHVGTGELIFTVNKPGSTFNPLRIFTNPINLLSYFLAGDGPLATSSGRYLYSIFYSEN